MKIISLMAVAWATLLCGCASKTASSYDEFEKIKVDTLQANQVSSAWLTRTLVCLNAARETRGRVAQTNVTVTLSTNLVVTAVTNLTVTRSGNTQVATLTNTAPTAPQETTSHPIETGSPANVNAGETVSTSINDSTASSPGQHLHSSTIQTVTSINSQGTVTRDSFLVTLGTNEVVSVETNRVITTTTNVVIVPVTNIVVTVSEHPVSDYYLYTEVAPDDFPLAAGESLVLLADGVRYGCNPSTPATAWKSRRGFLTTYYKVPPGVILAIANATEAKLRIKGTSGTLERTLDSKSLKQFREFVVNHFQGESKVATAH
jgi:hypothetical protein